MPTEEQLQEIHRLAVLGGVAEIAQDVGPRLTGYWLRVSRFREVQDVSQQTLTLGPHARTLYDLAWAKEVLSEPQEALKLYGKALKMYKAAGNCTAMADILSEIGGVYADLGQWSQALPYCQQALSIQEAVGDRRGQATTLNTLGNVYAGLQQWPQALPYYQQALAICEEVDDRRGQATTLGNLGGVYAGLKQWSQALPYYQQALAVQEAVGDRRGQATTLNNLGRVSVGLEQPQQALAYFQQALPIWKAVGDRRRERGTRYNLAVLYHTQGQFAEAVEQLRQVVELDAQVQHPDLESDTVMLHQIEQEWQQSRPQGDTTSGPQQSAGLYAAEAGLPEALQGAKHLLEQGQIGSARAILQDALQRYPREARLQHLSQVVSPGKVVPRDVRYSDRAMEIAWIKANSSHYRGKWVALLGEQVLAIGDSLKAVLQHVQALQLEDTPFIHHCG